jgi:NTP pyrophosphatase (non-canonical NTP hydrolase)
MTDASEPSKAAMVAAVELEVLMCLQQVTTRGLALKLDEVARSLSPPPSTTPSAVGEEGSRILIMRDKFDAMLPESYKWTAEHVQFLALAICGEAGELANWIKKQWRDGTDHSEEIRDEIADIRVYLELLAKKFGIEGDKLYQRVERKFERVVARHVTPLPVEAREDGK